MNLWENNAMEYIMNESNFNFLIEGCREEGRNGEYTDEGVRLWDQEIAFILDGETDADRWDRLRRSRPFLYTYGERSKIADGVLYVDSICFGKGKPNSYFAPEFWS